VVGRIFVRRDRTPGSRAPASWVCPTAKRRQGLPLDILTHGVARRSPTPRPPRCSTRRAATREVTEVHGLEKLVGNPPVSREREGTSGGTRPSGLRLGPCHLRTRSGSRPLALRVSDEATARPAWRSRASPTGRRESEKMTSPDSVPVVRFRSVGKTFPDGTVALRDLSFSVGAREFVSIVGPSGCGKSTLLRIVSNLIPTTTGQVECAAPDDVGYVFQDPTLLPWRTVEGNVKLLCQLHGVPSRETARLAREAIGLVGLRGFERHRPWALSGGMRMRVSLARSLTREPRLFLFDEPFGALDEVTRQRLDEELLRLFIHKRFAAMFITHSVSEAVYLSNRVLIMSARPGRILEEFVVPFAFPRAGLRFESRYAEVVAALARVLRGGSE
jgi:NitT/TauT family transport system ATP-binding protein